MEIKAPRETSKNSNVLESNLTQFRTNEEFESLLVTPNLSTAHHEEGHSLHVKYRKDVLAFVEIVQQLGNPFDPGQELVALDTQKVMEQEVVKSLSRVVEVGADLHAQYVSQTFDKVSIPVSNASRHFPIVLILPRKIKKKIIIIIIIIIIIKQHCCGE